MKRIESYIFEKFKIDKDIVPPKEYKDGDILILISLEYDIDNKNGDKMITVDVHNGFIYFKSFKGNEITLAYGGPNKNITKEKISLNSNEFFERTTETDETILYLPIKDAKKFLEKFILDCYPVKDTSFLYKYFDKNDNFLIKYPIYTNDGKITLRKFVNKIDEEIR